MPPFLIIAAIIFLAFMGYILLMYDRKECRCPYCKKQGHLTDEKKSEWKTVRKGVHLMMLRTVTRSYNCMSCKGIWSKCFYEEGEYEPETDSYDEE